MAGQSNMTGMANNADLPINLQSTQTNMPIYVSIQGDGSILDKWTYLKPGDGNSSLNHGCEVSFGDSLKKAYPNDSFAIIKCSSPGSCLETQWFSPSIGPWGGLYYNTFLISVNAALNSLPVGTTYEIVGMLWMQGETDATLATWANNYENNLTAFISDIRTALAAPQMPFMIGKIDIQTAWAYNSIVRQAQQNVAANVANCEFIETNGYNQICHKIIYG